jgi:phosphate-selective porin OprO and OprP
VKNIIKLSVVAAAMGLAQPALADQAETKGGLTVKTDDGRFEMKIGGRIHYDGYVLSEDDDAAFGSSGLTTQGGFAFRRTYLTLTGKLYGWKYKFENDFAAEAGTVTCSNVAAVPATPSCTVSNTGASGFREMWVSTQVGPGELMLGQFKPFRGMEELTSSNEITMIERPVTTATGIYANRQFLMGAGYKGLLANDTFGYQVHLMSLAAANSTNEGSSIGARTYWVPVNADGTVVHLGVAYSIDSEQGRGGSTVTTNRPQFGYAGRRGPVMRFGDAGGGAAISSDDHQKTLALEAASAFGPITLQAEYATATLEDADTTTRDDAKVNAWYLQAGWFLTGESAVYKADRGAFGKPKPLGEAGAWELVARYEGMENKDEDASNNMCSISTGTATGGGIGGETQCEATTLSAGVNWYLNPNVRFMLNYYMGEADVGVGDTDQPKAYTLRTQLSF